VRTEKLRKAETDEEELFNNYTIHWDLYSKWEYLTTAAIIGRSYVIVMISILNMQLHYVNNPSKWPII